MDLIPNSRATHQHVCLVEVEDAYALLAAGLERHRYSEAMLDFCAAVLCGPVDENSAYECTYISMQIMIDASINPCAGVLVNLLVPAMRGRSSRQPFCPCYVEPAHAC